MLYFHFNFVLMLILKSLYIVDLCTILPFVYYICYS